MQILIALLLLCAAAYAFGPFGIVLWGISVIFLLLNGNKKRSSKLAPQMPRELYQPPVRPQIVPPPPVPRPGATPPAKPQPAPQPVFRPPAVQPPVIHPPVMQPVNQPRPAPAPSPVRAPSISFDTFTDPIAGTFTVDVPQGWQVRGGLHHPGLGDRRMCVEAQSPDGIVVLIGDPNCPQCFCHYPMQTEDVMLPTAQGCTFLNIPASANRLANYYLKNIAPKRFGTLKVTVMRDRPDIAAEDLKRVRQMGMDLPSTWKNFVQEARFEAGRRTGCCYAWCGYNPAMSFGFMTVWEGSVNLYLAPPALQATAELVVARMRSSMRPTARMMQVVQQDEMIIAANGQAANMNQQVWFQGQQAAHQAQMAQGDAIMQNYWQQQKSNDNMMQGYLDAQHVNDRLSQDRSDAMLGKQRLYDDASGKLYEAPAGANSYWLNQHGQIVSSDTINPPDYQNNYTPLRKP